MLKISRLGAYGVAQKGDELLLIIQETGPYINLYDLPGGKIEFGETVEQTLHREFIEEVGMDFASMTQIGNFSSCHEVPAKGDASPYTFHRIGLIYAVSDLKVVEASKKGLQYAWIDIRALSQDEVSPFVWELFHHHQ